MHQNRLLWGLSLVALLIVWLGPAAAAPTITPANGGFDVTAGTYTARVSTEGALEKVVVGNNDLLDAASAGAHGGFLVENNAPVRLAQVTAEGDHVTATDGNYTLIYTFSDQGISVSCARQQPGNALWTLVAAEGVKRCVNAALGDGVPTPTRQGWSAVRFLYGSGPALAADGPYASVAAWGPGNARQAWLFPVAGGNTRVARLLVQAPAAAGDWLDMKVSADAPDHNFPAAAPVVFRVEVTNAGAEAFSGSVEVAATDYTTRAARANSRGEIASVAPGATGAPAQLTLEGVPAGFCDARFRLLRDGKVVKEKAAVFSVDAASLKPALEPPADLDAFWEKTLADLRKQPLDAHLTEVPALSKEQYTVYKVDYQSIDGIRVYGWYLAPKAPGRHAAMVTVPAAGIAPPMGPSLPSHPGFATLSIGVHGLPLDLPIYKARGYNGEGIESRETYIFRKIYCHAVRAVDFLVSRPEVDPERIGVTGSSQGGCLSLSTAALDPRIKLVVGNVPAHCHVDWIEDRGWGWGPNKSMAPGGDFAAMKRIVSYYDNANLAPRIHCPVLLSAGMLDRTCPPDGIAAVLNSIPAERKKLMFFPWMGHAGDPAFYAEGARWMQDVLHPEIVK